MKNINFSNFDVASLGLLKYNQVKEVRVRGWWIIQKFKTIMSATWQTNQSDKIIVSKLHFLSNHQQEKFLY